MSLSDLTVVSVEGQVQDYFLRSFFGENDGELLDFQVEKKGKKLISATFFCKDTLAVSLPMAPFGGIWVTGELGQPEVLTGFIEDLMEYFREKKIRIVRLIQPPHIYEPLSDLIHSELFKSGFSVKSIQSHQFLTGKKGIRSFLKIQGEKWKSKLEAKKLELVSSPIGNFGFLRDIQEWNSEKGYELTWQEDRLIRQVSLFPERYFKISIIHRDQPQAHAVGVKLTSGVLYYFLSANKPDSPFKNLGELLLFGLIKLAKEEKVEAVDLGSSEVNGCINSNLMYFKSRFSNEISNKIIWERQL